MADNKPKVERIDLTKAAGVQAGFQGAGGENDPLVKKIMSLFRKGSEGSGQKK